MLSTLALGLSGAVLFGIGMLTGARASREAGVLPTLFTYSIVTVAVSSLVAFTAHGTPSTAGSGDWAWLAACGVCYAAGAGFFMLAATRGEVSLVVPIVACDGGIAAVLSIAAGSSAVSVVSALCLAAMVVGVVLAVASGQESSPKGRIKLDSRTVLAAVLSAVTYGIVFFAASEVTALQPAWVTAFARAISLLPIAFLLLRAGGMTMPKPRTWRWIVATGAADALGFTAYIAAAEGDVPVAAVTTAQYAAIGVVGGVVFFGESLSWTQRAGIAMLLVSVSLLALAS